MGDEHRYIFIGTGSVIVRQLVLVVICLFLQKLIHHTISRGRPQHYTISSDWFAVSIGFMFMLLSLSRSGALYYGEFNSSGIAKCSHQIS